MAQKSQTPEVQAQTPDAPASAPEVINIAPVTPIPVDEKNYPIPGRYGLPDGTVIEIL